MYGGTSVANQGGYPAELSRRRLTADHAERGRPSPAGARTPRNLLIEDTLTWLKGVAQHQHGRIVDAVRRSGRATRQLLPHDQFRELSGDPALSLFTTRATSRGRRRPTCTRRSTSTRWLTGRVSRHQRRRPTRRGHRRSTDYMGTRHAARRMREAGLFLQDAWRSRAEPDGERGLRYELQYPFYPLNSSYSTATMADVCGVSGRERADGAATCSSRATLAASSRSS